ARRATSACARLCRAAVRDGEGAAGLYQPGGRCRTRVEPAAGLRRYAQALVAFRMAWCPRQGHGRSGMSVTICRVVIRGRVQGVGYRAWTEYTALELGLEGWVRNRRDGTVEALFAGPADDVAAMLEACRQGPLGARVEVVDEQEATPGDLALRRPGELFSVLRTA